MADSTLISAGGALTGPLTPPLYIPTLPIAGAVRRYITRYLTGSNGDAVASFPDLGSENVPLAQSSSSRRPLIAADTGYRVITFDGTDDNLNAVFTAQNPISTDSYTMYVVAKLPAFDGAQYIPWSLAQRRPLMASGANSGALYGATGSTSSITFTPGWHFCAMQILANSTAKWTIDGTVVGPTTFGTAANSLITVGGFSATDSTYAGAISLAEAGVYRSALSDANVASLRTYLKTIYSFLP